MKLFLLKFRLFLSKLHKILEDLGEGAGYAMRR